MDTVYTALVFPLLLLIGQALVAVGQRKISQRMDEGQAKTEAKRKEEAEWRERMEEAITDLKREVTKSKDAQQSTMRQSLIHSYEKYVTRGWLTTEELSAWLDMHDKYSAMGFNGLIDTYREHIVQLEIRPLDELAKCD